MKNLEDLNPNLELEQNKECAYKQSRVYGDKCLKCSGEYNIDICYISIHDLRKNNERWFNQNRNC